MREYVFDVVRQTPHLPLPDEGNGRGGNHLVIVIDELEQRLLDVARSCLEDDIATSDLLVERQVVEHRHDPLSELP